MTSIFAQLYITATGIALLVALYIDVRNNGAWPAFRTLRIRRGVLLVFLAWAAALQWPGFVSALTVANGRDQPASARVFIAPNPGSWEYRFGPLGPGSRIVRPDLLRPSTAAAPVAPRAAPISALRAYSPARSRPSPLLSLQGADQSPTPATC